MDTMLSSPYYKLHGLDRSLTGFDEFGFGIFNRATVVECERHHNYTDKRHSPEEVEAWEKIFSNWEDISTKWTSKLQTYIERGVPAQFRGRLWKQLLEIDTLQAWTKYKYQETIGAVREQLVDLGISEYVGSEAANTLSEMESDQYRVKYGQISLDALRHILLDLDRTYPTHRQFMGNSPEAKEGRAALFRVLAAYARYNHIVEYCQGMSSIAGMFLMQMGEEDAFWCMVSLFERHKYLAGYFHNSMHRIQRHAEVFESLLKHRKPKLSDHLSSVQLHPLMYVTPWFMCLYTGLPCWDTVMAIWDLLLLQGHKTIFRVGLAIMEVAEDQLMGITDLCSLLPVLLRLPVNVVSYKTLMSAIVATQIEDWEVNTLIAMIEEERPDTSAPPLLLPHSVRKRKHADDDDQEMPSAKKAAVRGEKATAGGKNIVFEFTGEPDRTKRQRLEVPVSIPDPVSSIFQRVINMFTPRHPEDASASMPLAQPRLRRSAARQRKQKSHDNVAVNIDKLPALAAAARHPLVFAERASRSPDATATGDKNGAKTKAMRSGQKVRSLRIPGPRATNTDTVMLSSPCKYLAPNSPLGNPEVLRVKGDTPVRRSPRLQHRQPLGILNEPTSNNQIVNSSSSPGTKHAFRTFNSQTPLRRSQRATPSRAALFVASPEVEMQELPALGLNPLYEYMHT